MIRTRLFHTLYGVTLLECMVVLSIISILTVATIPSVIHLIKNHRLDSTAQKLYIDLQYARSEAIKNNTTVYVNFQTGNNWCYGINIGSTCNCTTANSCSAGLTNAASTQQLSLAVTGFSSNTLQYEGTRGAANSSGTITFTLQGQSSLITLSIGRLGNSQMCSTGINGYTGC